MAVSWLPVALCVAAAAADAPELPNNQDPARVPPAYSIFLGKSAVNGRGTLVKGFASTGDVLVQSIVATRPTANLSKKSLGSTLAKYRSLVTLNHCWVPNAKLMRRKGPADAAVIEYDLVAVQDFAPVGPVNETTPTEVRSNNLSHWHTQR